MPISLFGLLFPGIALPAENAPDRVSLDGPVAGVLKVVAWKDGKSVEVRQLKSLGCLENGLVMVNPGAELWHGSFAVTFGAGNQDNFLFRSSDGWLILKRDDLAIVAPWFDFETSWYRFRPVDYSQ